MLTADKTTILLICASHQTMSRLNVDRTSFLLTCMTHQKMFKIYSGQDIFSSALDTTPEDVRVECGLFYFSLCPTPDDIEVHSTQDNFSVDF